MYNLLRNSTTGMIANQEKVNIVSNNIVNSQTTGYKKLDSGFLDLYTESLDRISYPNSSNGSLMGTGVKITQATRNLMQGSLKSTEIKTNLAIDGDGFFRVKRPDGAISYTRNGEFQLDANGRLVDDSGNILDIRFDNGALSENVNLSNGELKINKEGQVFLDNNRIGKIDLYMPQGTNDLIPIGDSLFALNQGANMDIAQESNIEQGYVEMSNVNLQNEMTDLIMAQRSFQFNSKGIKAIDDMWGMINNLQGR